MFIHDKTVLLHQWSLGSAANLPSLNRIVVPGISLVLHSYEGCANGSQVHLHVTLL